MGIGKHWVCLTEVCNRAYRWSRSRTGVSARVLVNGKVYGEGKGCGKKGAEKCAAEDALARLKAQGLLSG